MRKRLIIALTILIALISAFTVGRLFIDESYHGIIDNLFLFTLVYNIIYLWFGVPRLIVYFIYGVFMLPILFFTDKDYHLLLIFIFTIIVVLNPFASFEQFLDTTLTESSTKTFVYTPPGKYKLFYKYREEMKNHYHLPQVQKIYTKPVYRFLRTSSLLLLFASLIFLLLFSSSDIINLQGLDTRSIVTLYLAVLLTIALVVLYKKGFSSMSRVFKIGGFPPIIFLLAVWDINNIVKIISLIALSLGMITVIIREVIANYSRVVYSSYKYKDQKTSEKVWANALYEPFVYSSALRKSIIFEFELPEELFHKQFKSLLVRTNIYKTIITAYTIKKGKINLFIEYYKDKDKDRVQKAIENIYNVKILKKKPIDQVYYEKKFLHNHEYIIARALNLSHLLIELEIKEPVIISVTMNFKTKEDANIIAKKYQTQLLDETDDYCLVESSIRVRNVDYLIETELRSLLLEMLINRGTFVRVMVYY